MLTDSKAFIVDKAQRVLFFARYEAVQSNHSHVEVEHLLLGIIRADPGLFHRLYPGERDILFMIRNALGKPGPASHNCLTREELPLLSQSTEQVLQSAVAAQRDFGDHCVGTEQMLLGLLLQHDSQVGRILSGFGLTVDALQEYIASRGPTQAEELAD